jgi:hypothetical protein
MSKTRIGVPGVSLCETCWLSGVIDDQQSRMQIMKDLLIKCAIVIRKVQEEDSFYLPDEICGETCDEQLAFIDRLEEMGNS